MSGFWTIVVATVFIGLRLTREYRAGLRADLIDTLGIRDEVS